MKSFYFLLIVAAFALTDCKTGGVKEVSLNLKKADQYYDIAIYQYALPAYLEALKSNPEDPLLNLKAGICLVRTSHHSEAILFLERAAIGGMAAGYFFLGQCLHNQNNLDQALENYLLFKNNCSQEEYTEYDVDRFIEITQRAKAMMGDPVNVKIENLGSVINSPFADYVPVTNADESVLIFTSRREGSTGGLIDSQGRYYEDLYISGRIGDSWSEPQKLSEVVNTESHDACVSLTADGQKMVIYRMDEKLYGGDLYTSSLNGTEWTKPEKLGGLINSEYWEPSGSFSSDQKIFFFSSNRPGGYGGTDIYMSRKLPDGNWGFPINLGPVLNTPYDEDAPYIHPDGHTLYFSSRGHRTMGGFDIFKSQVDRKGFWSIPENIGYPINSVSDDIYFMLSADGKRGYYSSEQPGGHGEKDLYIIHMPEEVVPITILKGYVAEAGTKIPVDAVITIINNDTKEVQGIYRPNSSSGKFIIVLPPNIPFKAVVESNGFHSFAEDLEVNHAEGFKEISKDFYLKKD